jgi:SPP1 family predicted phage head-tail adaptor
MGIGSSRMIKIVIMGSQTGADGIEPNATEVANIWANVNTVSQSKGFDANKAAIKTSYEFLVRYDSGLAIGIDNMIEYNNRRYSIQTIERVDRVRAKDKFAAQLFGNPDGRYWRIVAISEDVA